MTRCLHVLPVFLAFITSAHATEKPATLDPTLGPMTCADIRAVVAITGAAEAERMARAAGASEARIAAAKKCLKVTP